MNVEIQKLGTKMSLFNATILIIGCIAGTGVFSLPSSVFVNKSKNEILQHK